MPNHCAGRLYVRGDVDQLQAFGIEAMGHDGRNDEALDIENFLPMPKELEGIVCGGITINGKQYKSWRRTKDVNGNEVDVGLTDDEMKRFMKKYGATNGLDWSVAKLGTKWGAYESSLRKGDDGSVVYDFQTAWSPFSPEVLRIISKKYPTLEFEYKFAERGCGFFGYTKARAGAITDDEDFDTKGRYNEKDECWDDSKFSDSDYPELLGRSG